MLACPLSSSPSCFPRTTTWSCAGPSFTCLTRLGRPSPGSPATTPGIQLGTVPADFSAAATRSCSLPANSSLSEKSHLCTVSLSGDYFQIFLVRVGETLYFSFSRRVLEKTSGIEDPGGLHWELFGCLLLGWVIIFLCLVKGIKSTGKVTIHTVHVLKL